MDLSCFGLCLGLALCCRRLPRLFFRDVSSCHFLRRLISSCNSSLAFLRRLLLSGLYTNSKCGLSESSSADISCGHTIRMPFDMPYRRSPRQNGADVRSLVMYFAVYAAVCRTWALAVQTMYDVPFVANRQ